MRVSVLARFLNIVIYFSVTIDTHLQLSTPPRQIHSTCANRLQMSPPSFTQGAREDTIVGHKDVASRRRWEKPLRRPESCELKNGVRGVVPPFITIYDDIVLAPPALRQLLQQTCPQRRIGDKGGVAIYFGVF